jgi:hypothetical protein
MAAYSALDHSTSSAASPEMAVSALKGGANSDEYLPATADAVSAGSKMMKYNSNQGDVTAGLVFSPGSAHKASAKGSRPA